MRLTALQAVTCELAAAASVAQVSAVLVDSARDAIGAQAAALRELVEGQLVLVAERGFPGATGDPHLARVTLDSPFPSAAALRGDAPVWLEDLGALPELAGLPAMQGLRSLAAVPFDREVAGTLLFAWDQPRTFSSEDREFIQVVASLCEQALSRARLAEANQATAELLQRSLLPAPALLTIPGLSLGICYQPSRGAWVGGDVFDVFPTPRGHGILLADVSGHGVEAAALTAMIRHTTRVLACYEPSPAAVLARLNDHVCELDLAERYCTAVVGEVIGATFTLSFAGHPPPLRTRLTDQGFELVECAVEGEAVGLVVDPLLTDVTLDLTPGEILVLCTDGALEARGADGVMRDTLLRDTLRAALEVGVRDPRILARLVVEAVMELEGGLPRDDVAVIVCTPATEELPACAEVVRPVGLTPR